MKNIRTYTVQEFRKLQNKETVPKRRTKKRKPKQKIASPKKPLIYSRNKIVIGYDADISKCGIAAYDVQSKEVLLFKSVPYNDLYKELDFLIERFGLDMLYARVEKADDRTIYAKVEKTIGSKEKVKQKIAFGIIKKSGRSLELANQFIHLLESKGIKYEVIESTSRFNVSTRLKGSLKNKTGIDLRQYFQLGLKTSLVYPTKLNAEQIKHFFPSLKKGGNSESRDALSLCIPDVLFNWKKKSV